LIVNGALSKTGLGQLLLNRSAGSTLTGGVTVDGGTLRVENVSGSATGSGTVAINSTGTLAGGGIISGSVAINDGATIAPGASARHTCHRRAFARSELHIALRAELAGTIGGNVNDLVNVNGALTLDGTLAVTELPGFSNGSYTLFDYSGALTNNGLTIQPAFLTAHPGSTIQIDSANTRVNLVVVPEPAAAATLMAGLATTLLGLRRDRHSQSLE
jgi:fibronectin-binding autotransporter adhesin